MGKFAVIDTETNWSDQVMSIGTVIADEHTFQLIDAKYHILPLECKVGGMYSDTLFLETPVKPILCKKRSHFRFAPLVSAARRSIHLCLQRLL